MGKNLSASSDKKPSPRYIALRCRCHCLLLAVDCNWIKPFNTELFELYSGVIPDLIEKQEYESKP